MARDPQTAADKFDDEHYPAYTMGRAAEMLGATPGFLRSLDEVKLLVPQRSAGGHRRYSRYQLRLAAPRPPTAAQAARIVNESWRDPDWGALVWTAMWTGVRRGESPGSGARSPPTLPAAADPARRTTPGSPQTASPTTSRSPPSTPRTFSDIVEHEVLVLV
jgi:hypothetical protein